MYDQVHGRELPNMEDWDQALIDEAIACKVQFGVLVLGQGSVIGRLVEATRRARMAVIKVTWDPRGWMEGVNYPTDMRYIGEIPYPANNFSLMRVEKPKPVRDRAQLRQAARRVIAEARTATAARDGRTSQAELEQLLRAAHPAMVQDRMQAQAQMQANAQALSPTQAPASVVAAGDRPMSPLRKRILRTRAG